MWCACRLWKWLTGCVVRLRWVPSLSTVFQDGDGQDFGRFFRRRDHGASFPYGLCSRSCAQCRPYHATGGAESHE